jgi:cytidine deaminase
LEIICLNADGSEQTFTLAELLPHSFGPEHLG